MARRIYGSPWLILNSCTHSSQNRAPICFRTRSGYRWSNPFPVGNKNIKTTHGPVVRSNDTENLFLHFFPCCPGCGAYSRFGDGAEAGIFNKSRSAVREYLDSVRRSYSEHSRPYAVSHQIEQEYSRSSSEPPGLNQTHQSTGTSGQSISKELFLHGAQQPTVPFCERCHGLAHHSHGAPAPSPSLIAIRELLSQGTHKRNRIYHILDAADFPLSLIPNLGPRLLLARPRSRNRRAKGPRFRNDRSLELNYIITRSDLLASSKEQVDRLMPKLIKILRDALGTSGKNVRLGNVRAVSAMRGWWTSSVKSDIWNHGGAFWMVGKTNVGKSKLLDSILPKSPAHLASPLHSMQIPLEPPSLHDGAKPLAPPLSPNSSVLETLERDGDTSEAFGIQLPPVARETPFPTLPLVSAVAGTTALPIPLSFGNGKGQIIDLPGLNRGGLHTYVREQSRRDLLLQSRVKPKQLIVSPGQSLLLGGLIRISLIEPSVPMLVTPFVPMEPHITATEKAIAFHTQLKDLGRSSIAISGCGNQMISAGRYALRWDVTKEHAGPLVRNNAANLTLDTLQFKVFAIDVLIEGCGWVEIRTQIRKKEFEQSEVSHGPLRSYAYPQIEISSPRGQHVGVRQPLNAWILNTESSRTSRRSRIPSSRR